MRNLKFRAWDKVNQHMAYSDKHEWDYSFSFDGSSGDFACAVNCCYCDTFGDEHDDWRELDNIMQNIGKQDINDKDIYEGDIVRHYNVPDDRNKFGIGIVFFDEESYSFRRTGEYETTYCMKEDCIYEVIGNIYENPDLLDRLTEIE